MPYILTKAFLVKLSFTPVKIYLHPKLIQMNKPVILFGKDFHCEAFKYGIRPNNIRFLVEKVYFCYPKRRHGKHSSHI